MTTFRFGSHLPVLMEAINRTTGPVLELGSGYYSTVYLHWACFNARRSLTTIENNWEYYKGIRKLRNDWHEIIHVKKWEDAEPHYKKDWSVVLVDQGPGKYRGWSAQRLLHADYVVLHDTETPKSYGYEEVYSKFKYFFNYAPTDGNTPSTGVLSNKHNLTNFLVRP